MRELLRRLRDDWNSPYRRPLWQIVLLLPMYPFYLAASAFVDFWDKHL